MNRSEILGTAKSHISRDREATHGKPENSFGRIANMWGALLGHAVTSEQVALMMSCLKIARAWGNPAHADNWIDLAGYAACGGEIATTTNTPTDGLPFAVVKAQRDAERAMDTDHQPLEWPAEPASAPPDGLADVSATRASKSAEGTPAARVCGGCMWMLENGHCGWLKRFVLQAEDACGLWQPRSDLASLAARDATAWQGQDGGVE